MINKLSIPLEYSDFCFFSEFYINIISLHQFVTLLPPLCSMTNLPWSTQRSGSWPLPHWPWKRTLKKGTSLDWMLNLCPLIR